MDPQAESSPETKPLAPAEPGAEGSGEKGKPKKPKLRRKRAGRRGPKDDDFLNLSVLMKVVGMMLILCGCITMLIDLYWGIGFAGLGLVTWYIGRGLGLYLPWAWKATVFLLVPMYAFFPCIAIVYAVMEKKLHIIVQVFSGGSLIPVGYVCWVLLSKGGRERFQLKVEGMKKVRENPEGLAARTMRKR